MPYKLRRTQIEQARHKERLAWRILPALCLFFSLSCAATYLWKAIERSRSGEVEGESERAILSQPSQSQQQQPEEKLPEESLKQSVIIPEPPLASMESVPVLLIPPIVGKADIAENLEDQVICPLAEIHLEEISTLSEVVVKAPVKPKAKPRPAQVASQSKKAGETRAVAYKAAPKPPYPSELRSRRIEGSVRVRIHVNAEGGVTRVDLVESSGHRELDETARRWVMGHWSFHPAMKGGECVASLVSTSIHFRRG